MKETQESSASSWATFKEDIPSKVSVGGPAKSKKKKKSVETAVDPGATLMGRLASRMTSRDIIDNVNLGPKAKPTYAKRAAIADDEVASDTHPETFPPNQKKASTAPVVADYMNEIPSKVMVGPGLHLQTSDMVAKNFSNPISEGKKAPGSNMLDQAVYAGNVVESKDFKKMANIRGK